MEKDKMALLIDAENVSFRYIPKIMTMLDNYLKDNPTKIVTHKLGFANWQLCLNDDWEKALKENAIKQKHTPSYSKGKNGTDISLVIYAMEAAFTKDIETFVIVTGDSDFTDLVYKLIELGKNVIVCGDSNIATSLRNAGNEFWEIIPDKKTQEEKARKRASQNAKALSDKNVVKTIAEKAYYNKLRKSEKCVDMSVVYSEMLEIAKENNRKIDYKQLGHKKLKSFFESLRAFDVIAIDKKTTITYMLKHIA